MHTVKHSLTPYRENMLNYDRNSTVDSFVKDEFTTYIGRVK